MNENDDIRKGRHCVYDLHVHLVFVTKYRHDVFTSEHLTALEHVFADVCRSFDCRLEEFNGAHIIPADRRTQPSGQQSQRRVKPYHAPRLPGTRPPLLEGATSLVPQLLRGHQRRCAIGHVETVHRKPEPARVIHHRPEGRCTLTQKRLRSGYFLALLNQN